MIFFLCSYNEQQTTSTVRFHSHSQLNTNLMEQKKAFT